MNKQIHIINFLIVKIHIHIAIRVMNLSLFQYKIVVTFARMKIVKNYLMITYSVNNVIMGTIILLNALKMEIGF